MNSEKHQTAEGGSLGGWSPQAKTSRNLHMQAVRSRECALQRVLPATTPTERTRLEYCKEPGVRAPARASGDEYSQVPGGTVRSRECTLQRVLPATTSTIRAREAL